MSIVIVALPGAPTISEEVQKADVECEAKIREYVDKVLKEQPDIDTASIVHSIAVKEVEIPGLPPGGGIHTKYVMEPRCVKLNAQVCSMRNYQINFISQNQRTCFVLVNFAIFSLKYTGNVFASLAYLFIFLLVK